MRPCRAAKMRKELLATGTLGEFPFSFSHVTIIGSCGAKTRLCFVALTQAQFLTLILTGHPVVGDILPTKQERLVTSLSHSSMVCSS